jgi:pSer/pThr/pTyr-binding forkhead associated (FHA) protein
MSHGSYAELPQFTRGQSADTYGGKRKSKSAWRRGTDKEHADVRLDDPCVSRVHCEVSDLNGTLVVRDLGSKHGTYVNGQKVTQAPLLPGDRLTVGVSSFEVQYERRRTKPSIAPARI